MIFKHARTGHAGTRGAFTLIELLVVVAIIALLISILLPSLARAREGARATICLTGLKQMGGAVLMYIIDSKGMLPGPIHAPVYHETARLKGMDTNDAWYFKGTMPYFLQAYIGDKSGRAELLDRVATCPSAARIPHVTDPTNPIPAYQLDVNGAYQPNTGAFSGPASANIRRPPTYPDRNKPYYATVPGNYFGWSNLPLRPGGDEDGDGIRDWFDHDHSSNANPVTRENKFPKPIDRVKKQSEEWMMADLWVWYGGGGITGVGPVGTWPFAQGSTNTGSVAKGGDLKCPGFPFHYTMKSFSGNLNDTDAKLDSPRLTSGKTNAVYFDGHGDSVRPFLGTVNPLMR